MKSVFSKYSQFKIVCKPGLWLKWWKTWQTLPVLSWILGAHYFREGRFEIAAQFYHRGLKKNYLHRAYSCAQLDYAYCLYRSGQWMEAKDILLEIIFSRSALKEAFLLLAEIEGILGQQNLVVRRLERCGELYPGDVSVAIRLVHALAATPFSQEPLLNARASLLLLRKDQDVNGSRIAEIDAALAHTELVCGDAAKGEQMLARIIVSNVSSFEALILHASWLLAKGRLGQARKQLARAMNLKPRHPAPPMLLARSYLAAGSSSSGEYALQLAVEGCKLSFWQNAEALQILADAYEASGDQSASLLVLSRIQGLAELQHINIEELKYLETQVNRLREIADISDAPNIT